MSPTLVYILRLAAWLILLSAFLGPLIWLSWRLQAAKLASHSAAPAYRLARTHLVGIVALPAAILAGGVTALVAMGAEVRRQPPVVDPAIEADWTAPLLASALILGIWAAGAVIALIRCGIDWLSLRHLPLSPATPQLTTLVRRMGKRVPEAGHVRVRIGPVAGPLVKGSKRPILILPPDFFDTPEQEREALILHELAHVLRRDYLCNLQHRLLLAGLWFQPAAWALLRRLGRDRELLCDQLAVERGAAPVALARALLRLADDNRRPGLAMAADHPSFLKVRITNLLELGGPLPRNLPIRHRFAGAAALLGAGLCGTQLVAADTTVTHLHLASIFGPVIAIDARDAAGTFELRIRRGRVLEASLSERALPRSHIVQQGGRVTLVDHSGTPAVSLNVYPHGRVQWDARTPPRTGD